MFPENERDPLSELLSGVELPPADPLQREAIFSKTRGVLRRRRVVRRCTWIAALAACYVVGGLSVLAWQSAQPDDQFVGLPGGDLHHRYLTRQQMTDSPTPTPTLPANGEGADLPPFAGGSRGGGLSDPAAPRINPTDSSDASPTAIARSELAVSLTTFEKLRQAGDRQLNERGNIKGAIGCYRRALDYASDEELKIVPERDSWLLIPLKEARLETHKHVRKKS